MESITYDVTKLSDTVEDGIRKASFRTCPVVCSEAIYIETEGDIIRIVCDNHSAHKSKETRNYLATRPEGRFVFVFTPKHGSWLNMIESFFSKMTKQMLKGIRVESKEELKHRIYLYFEEVNREPVVYHWSYKMDEISVAEATEAGVKSNEVCVS